jgi:preprotein translocase subunit YajC
MFGPLDITAILFAQANNAAPGGGGQELLNTLIMFAPIIFLFYFLMVRPQQQQERKRRRMIAAIKPNDRVLTGAGIYGTVVKIDPEKDQLVLRVADGVKLNFTRSSVVQVLEGSDKEKTAEPS